VKKMRPAYFVSSCMCLAIHLFAQQGGAPPWYSVRQEAGIHWSPDGQHLGSVNEKSTSPITAMTPFRGGVLIAVAQLEGKDNTYGILWSADGKHIGSTVRYRGVSPVTAMIPYENGLLIAVANYGGQANQFAVVWSDDGTRLGEGPNPVRYKGVSPVTAMVPYKGGVLTALADVDGVPFKNSVSWHADGKNLGSGPWKYEEKASPITAMMPYRDGVLVAYANVGGAENEYSLQWTRDGQAFGDGAEWYKGVSPIMAMIAYKGGVLASFANLGGQKNQHSVNWSPNGRNLANVGPQCVTGTVQRYCGMSPVTAIVPYKSGVLTAFGFLPQPPTNQTKTGVIQNDGRIELGWMNIFPCSRVEWVKSSIFSLPLPTLELTEQRLYLYTAVKAQQAPADAIRECAVESLAACGLASLASGGGGCVPAFTGFLKACLAQKAQNAALDSLPTFTTVSRCVGW
jgi:hypothetical protein